MKKKFALLMLIASVSGTAFAQGEMDAFNFSYNDLTGTAHSVAMGGAFGALGGDVSAISINPAGIGIYKSSEIVTTLNFTNNRTQTNLTNTKTKDSKFNFNFDNIAFVGTVPIRSDVAPLINFGFSYNRLKSFNRKVSLRGVALQNSQSDYIADRSYGVNNSNLSLSSGNFMGSDWLGILGYNGNLIQNTANSSDQYQSTLLSGNLDNNLYLQEKGSIDSYDFNLGTTFGDMLSVGASVSVTDINYRMYSIYTENWYPDGVNYTGGYDLENFLRTDGTGWQVKVGAIFKPIQELRIGVSYHSPTWYQMTDYYSAILNSDVNGTKNTTIDTYNYAGDTYTDYDLRTPDKWTFSLAGIIGQRVILSADYELTNYKNMHLKDSYGSSFITENQYIKSDFRNASTLRIGAEVRILPELSARVGYVWQQSPFQKSFKDINDAAANDLSIPLSELASTAGTVTNYSIVGDANYITYGLGYQFNQNFYTDIAFVMKSRKDDLYTYATANKAELKNNLFSGLITLGYRF